MHVTKGKIVKYAVLPGIFPRIFELFGAGFIHIAYLMAAIYQATGLLPADHPYLNPQNFGRFGIRHVIAEAAGNLVMDRKNIDKIFVFFVILTGLVLLCLQICLLILTVIAQPALAQSASFSEWFLTPSAFTTTLKDVAYGPTHDIAFMILDRIFGLERIFNSCIADVGQPCLDSFGRPIPTPENYPYPMHVALHQLLQFYSLGILFIGAMVIIYYVTTIVAETARTGTPFGQRFNKAWAVPRLILFFALLAPLNSGGSNAGINGAQLFTFWAAKLGSNMATNAWSYFNTSLTGTYMGGIEGLVATPNAPDIGSLAQFMFVARTCKIAEALGNGRDIQAYMVRESFRDPNHKALDLVIPTYQDALEFADKGTMTIVFGERDPDKHGTYKGFVHPTCGEIHIEPNQVSEPGALAMQEGYMHLILAMWKDLQFDVPVECMVRTLMQIDQNPACTKTDWPDSVFIDNIVTNFRNSLNELIKKNVEIQKGEKNWVVPPEILQRGWAGAGIWFNRIAQMNGAMTASVFNIPRPHQYPSVMEEIYEERKQSNESLSGADRFDPFIIDKKTKNLKRADLGGEADQKIAVVLHSAYSKWGDSNAGTTSRMEKSDNIFINMINTMLGTSGLFDMKKNVDVHPLAQLTAIGKGMIEASVRNGLIAGGGVVGKGIADLIGAGEFLGAVAKTAGNVATSFIFVSLILGFILFYVLPFMPFIYFLFAIAGWIKSIFEATVAMPLWALAHLRIDGEGMPGPGASDGYFLLFEIFLRPIMIVFGLLASITIFSALIFGLNDVFDIVISNMTGADAESIDPLSLEYYRGPVDQFFYTIIYVVVVYLAAVSSFKLIDMIPQKMLRWIGFTKPTFQENAGDPAGEVMQKVYKGGLVTTGQVARGKLAALLPD